jgi:serine/alanine adding enzyme
MEASDRTFGHPGHYLKAMIDGTIRGVLPLVEVRSRLFGHSMVSVPFFSHGGVLARSVEARSSLLAEAERLGREFGVRHIELRQGRECELGWRSQNSKVAMGLPLPASVEELMGSFPGKVRNRIRYSEEQGFELREGGVEAVGDFYRIFAINMWHLGTPVYPQEWFENICRSVSDRVHILSAWEEKRAVAASFLIGLRDTLEVPWSASLPASRKRYSAMWMEWKMLEWAVRRATVGWTLAAPRPAAAVTPLNASGQSTSDHCIGTTGWRQEPPCRNCVKRTSDTAGRRKYGGACRSPSPTTWDRGSYVRYLEIHWRGCRG